VLHIRFASPHRLPLPQNEGEPRAVHARRGRSAVTARRAPTNRFGPRWPARRAG
jgi:hypothetical protein